MKVILRTGRKAELVINEIQANSSVSFGHCVPFSAAAQPGSNAGPSGQELELLLNQRGSDLELPPLPDQCLLPEVQIQFRSLRSPALELFGEASDALVPSNLQSDQPVSNSIGSTRTATRPNDDQRQQQQTRFVPRVMIPMPLLSDQSQHYCLATEPTLTKAVQFYVLSTEEDFSICCECYLQYVAPHEHITKHFTQFLSTGTDVLFTCDMSFPRVRRVFHAECIPAISVLPLKDLTAVFSRLKPCRGLLLTGFRTVYAMVNDDIPNFAACETCYQLYIRSTVFETNFASATISDDAAWFCGMAAPIFVKFLTNELNKPRPNFVDFVNDVGIRMMQPPCSGPGKVISNDPAEEKFAYCTRGLLGFFCSACYLDRLKYTPFEHFLERISLSSDQARMISCGLSADGCANNFLDYLINDGDDQKWREIVEIDSKLAPCHSFTGQDEADLPAQLEIKGDLAQWFHFEGHPNVLVCPRCYWLLIKVMGASRFFVPVTRPLISGIIRQCAFAPSNHAVDTDILDEDAFENSTAWRGRRLRAALSFGRMSQDWNLLISEVHAISLLPPACGSFTRGFKHVNGRKWYGRHRAAPEDVLSLIDTGFHDTNVFICEECFGRATKDTVFAPVLFSDLTAYTAAKEDSSGFVCQAYTNRARRLIRTVSDNGDLSTFAQVWNNRNEWKSRLDRSIKLLTERGIDMKTKFTPARSPFDPVAVHTLQIDTALLNAELLSDIASPDTEELLAIWEAANRGFLAVE